MWQQYKEERHRTSKTTIPYPSGKMGTEVMNGNSKVDFYSGPRTCGFGDI